MATVERKCFILASDANGEKGKNKALAVLEKNCKYDILNITTAAKTEEGQSFQEDVKIYEELCSAVIREKKNGVLFSGSGMLASIFCNKFAGIRAALAHNQYVAGMCRLHNDANILIVGTDFLGNEVVLQMLDEFMSVQYVVDPSSTHFRRLGKLAALEKDCGC